MNFDIGDGAIEWVTGYTLGLQNIADGNRFNTWVHDMRHIEAALAHGPRNIGST